MATVDYLHLCDTAFQMEGGKHCVIGIFEEIHAMSFPAAHAAMTVATAVRDKPHTQLSLRFEFTSPIGQALANVSGDFTTGQNGVAHFNLNIQGLPLPEPGRYSLRVIEGSRTLVTHTFRVVRAQVTTAPQQTH
jgi:hypothetical protein